MQTRFRFSLRVLILLGLVWAVGLLASSVGQTGAPGVVLPPGVKRIIFGEAVTTKTATGGLVCSIPQPLPEPVVFSAGTMKISYVIEVDPQVVPALTAAIVGDFGSKEIRGAGCERAAVCAGQLCQPQYGRTYSNSNGAPINQSGSAGRCQHNEGPVLREVASPDLTRRAPC
jgi:hypothetical protein